MLERFKLQIGHLRCTNLKLLPIVIAVEIEVGKNPMKNPDHQSTFFKKLDALTRKNGKNYQFKKK
jgi:hypothetical protein